MAYDIFMSHASEDKLQVALPLTSYLESRGYRVWLDEFELAVGDSLRRNIDKGLSAASFGVVILSPSYLQKAWTNRELEGLIARDDGHHILILPVWHNLSREDVLQYSPTLVDRVAVSTEQGIEYVGEQIVRAIERSRTADSMAQGDLERFRRAALHERNAEEITQLRRQLLTAKTHFDLEYVLYTVEEFLRRYPGHPEARQLRQRAENALRRELPPLLPAAPEIRRANILVPLLLLLGLLLLLILRCPSGHLGSRGSAVDSNAAHEELSPQEVDWVPNDPARGAGVCIDRCAKFIPWNRFEKEVKAEILSQVPQVPVESSLRLLDSRGRRNWVIQIMGPLGTETAHIWIGNNPTKAWAYDGLVHVGSPKAPVKIWASFQRYSNGTYRRK